MPFPTLARGFLRRLALLPGLALLAALPAQAQVPTLIVDATTGEVLHSEDATRPWFPASTTKLMTAYVALRAVRSGQIAWDTPIIVSKYAARQPPSKIGLKPGQEITLENAIKVLMVKSANDVATIVAEGVAGSVPAFAGMMNREAARLGMRESHFVNPHGLHNDAQVTSARDMAILARALLAEFPEHNDLWGIGAVKLGKRVYKNTNGLIGRYSGAIGMKTGFVCASGFNLVSAAERNGKTLIAVVFGAASGPDRAVKAAQLLDQGFGRGGGFFGTANSGRTLAALTASVETRAPNRRADICGKRGPPVSDDDDFGGTVVAIGQSIDSPDRVIGTGRVGESASVGTRAGDRVQLGPRAEFVPVELYLGRKPGSTAVARGAGTPASPTAQAFAPATGGSPLALPGAFARPAAATPGPRAKARPAAKAGLKAKETARPPATRAAAPAASPLPPKRKVPPKAAPPKASPAG